jgi:hypothetical protein
MIYPHRALQFVSLLIAPFVLLLINCGEESPQAPDPPVDTEDITPPAAVTGLYTGNPTAISVPLVWNAPGDDGDTGRADHYDIRYSLSEITDGNWDDATPIDYAPTPKPAPGLETVVIKGLGSNKTYYFALKTWDEAGNVSGLSNNASATTQKELQAPAAINSLTAEAISTNEYLLTWKAPGDDGWLGQADRYDIRYSTDVINGANWPNATQMDGEPAPSPTGDKDSCVVFIPDPVPDANYYFAVKTADEVPNWSNLSNVVMAIPIGVDLVIYPTRVLVGSTKNMQITFRSRNEDSFYRLSVLYYEWAFPPTWTVLRHFPEYNGNYPVGVHTVYWDLLADDGGNIPVGTTMYVRLYRGATPVDSLEAQAVRP